MDAGAYNRNERERERERERKKEREELTNWRRVEKKNKIKTWVQKDVKTSRICI